MKKIGIDALSYYVPSLYVDMEKLAEHRDIPFAKLNKGLGLNKMAFPDVNEDAASFAANALYKLIIDNDIDPRELGRIYLGTESALDAAKPTISYVVGSVESKLEDKFGKDCFKNCDVVDMTFACVAAVDAMQNCTDWIRAGSGRKAVVVASDFAKYALGSGGEYTQGAGAVAALLCEDPSIIAITDAWGVGFKSVGDFFKPRRLHSKLEVLKETAQLLGTSLSDEDARLLLNNNESEFWSNDNNYFELFKEEPVFDGPYSNACYKARISEAMSNFRQQKDVRVLSEWKHLVFHLPYAFQARRMIFENWLEWLEEENKIDELYAEYGKASEDDFKEWKKKVTKSEMYLDFISSRIERGERASAEIGNMYTASIFMSLLSLLSASLKDGIELSSDRIAFLSYGSGSKSKVFEGEVQASWKNRIEKLGLFEALENRTEISIEQYEQLHRCALEERISKEKRAGLHKIEQEGELKGLREYRFA